MAKTISIPRLVEYGFKITENVSQGVKNSSEVYIEYVSENYSLPMRRPVKLMRIEQTEHGPLTLIISEIG